MGSASRGSLVEKQLEQLAVAENSIDLPEAEERDEGDNHHERLRKDLVPPSTVQVLRDDVPGLVMRQAVDHVLDHGKYPYESPEYYGLEQDRIFSGFSSNLLPSPNARPRRMDRPRPARGREATNHVWISTDLEING